LPLAGAMRRISVVNPTGETIADDFSSSVDDPDAK